VVGTSYVLMACIREDNNWKSSQRRDWTGPFKDSDRSAVGESVTSDVVRYNEHDKIGDREQCHDAGVLERIQTS
jgi:hypothetical protein